MNTGTGDLSDGFGERNDQDVLDDVEPLMHWLVHKVAPRSEIHDDLAQEALLAFWRTQEKHPGKHRSYYIKAARSRVINLLSRDDPMAGSEPEKRTNTYRPKTHPIDWQDPIAADLFVSAGSLLEGVELAYHHGQILQAIRSLSRDDQDYVLQRFWLGKTNTEIEAERGIRVGSAGQRWTKAIRPALARRLAHLASV